MKCLRKPVPDVIIGGAPRCGTTFVAEVLTKHPDVFVAQPIIPEPKVLLTAHPQGDEGFFARYAEFFADSPPKAVRVEKTSNYFENAEARMRIARLLPDVKLIFILREPIARAYSNWLWSTKNGLETLSFEEAIEREGTRSSPLPAERHYARPFDYVTRAQYGSFASAWLEDVGRDRIRFFLFEQAVAQPAWFVAQLQSFIAVDHLPWSSLETGRVNATDAPDAKLDDGLVETLKERLRPEMERLRAVTGLEIGVWGF